MSVKAKSTNPDIKTIFDEVEYSYFQYIMSVHCDDDSAIELDADQAWYVLHEFTELLNNTITKLTKLENRTLHMLVDHLAVDYIKSSDAHDKDQLNYVVAVFTTRVKAAIDKAKTK